MSAIAIPRAPRAMVQQGGGGSTAPSLERVFHSASKDLYPRLVLFEALAGFKDGHQRREPSSDDICEARREYQDSFAYLCDVEKGGATVTATGLQKLLHSNILWLAANEGVREDVKTYAENILRKLKGVESGTKEAVQDDIFRLAVKKCNSRVEYYKVEMQKYARNCRMQLRQEMRYETHDTGAVRLCLRY
jgi:hypothetical protein